MQKGSGLTLKERSGMPYDVVAYEADEAAMLLTPEQEGLFHRLLRRAWMNGSIPDDIDKCASICRVTKLQMRRAWPSLRPLWVESQSEIGRLLNAKQEREREWKGRYTTAQAERGRLGGIAKALKNKDTDLANAKQTPSKRSGLPLPFPSPPLPKNTNTREKKNPSPSAQRHDPAADLFAESYQQNIGNPYGWQAGDFPQLAKLRKRLGIGTQETPGDWEPALLNYFGSPFAEFSLQHFASKFDTFKFSRLDRFKVPENHVNGGHNGNGRQPVRETDHEKNQRAVRDFVVRSMAPEMCGDVSDVREDIGGFPRKD